MKKFIQKLIRFFCKWVFISLIVFCILSASLVGSLRWVDPPTSRFIIRYEKSAQREVKRQWISFEQIAWHMSLAVIASEDQLFPKHQGFDWVQIRKVLENYSDGQNLRGASTISQQTIKNLFLTPEKTLQRKSLEAWLTFWLELTVPKKRILEIYLNIAQFGKSSFGVNNAAEHYFNVNANQLNPAQARLLATCLPAPSRCNPTQPTQHTLKKTAWIETSMRKLGGKRVIDQL